MARNILTRFIILPFVYSPRLKSAVARPADRTRPLFLILRDQFSPGGEQFGNSNEEHILSGPLRSADIAESVEYYYDQDYLEGLQGDRKLVELAAEVRPDLVVLSSYNPSKKQHPSISVLNAIRSQLQVPMLVMWSDTTTQAAVKTSSRISGLADLNVMNESGYLVEQFPESSNYLQLWASLDFSTFHPGDGPRDIPVSFLGTANWYRGIRQIFLDYLKQQNIPVYQAGGKDDPITLEEYADVFRRSKISINFSQSVGDTYQLKGRVFEILFSGAMMLESEGPETPKFFRPMIDYVPFSSKEDLADKIRYYLEHEEEREKIAQSGYQRSIKDYNHNVYWDTIVAKLHELDVIPASTNGWTGS